MKFRKPNLKFDPKFLFNNDPDPPTAIPQKFVKDQKDGPFEILEQSQLPPPYKE